MKTLINWPVFHTEIWVCFWNDQVFCSWQKNYWHPVLTSTDKFTNDNSCICFFNIVWSGSVVSVLPPQSRSIQYVTTELPRVRTAPLSSEGFYSWLNSNLWHWPPLCDGQSQQSWCTYSFISLLSCCLSQWSNSVWCVCGVECRSVCEKKEYFCQLCESWYPRFHVSAKWVFINKSLFHLLTSLSGHWPQCQSM